MFPFCLFLKDNWATNWDLCSWVGSEAKRQARKSKLGMRSIKMSGKTLALLVGTPIKNTLARQKKTVILVATQVNSQLACMCLNCAVQSPNSGKKTTGSWNILASKHTHIHTRTRHLQLCSSGGLEDANYTLVGLCQEDFRISSTCTDTHIHTNKEGERQQEGMKFGSIPHTHIHTQAQCVVKRAWQ